MRRIRWEQPGRRVPKHPYRDSAVLYAVLAAVVVGVSAATGGNVGRAATVASGLYVAATAYAWWRWRERLRRHGEEQKP